MTVCSYAKHWGLILEAMGRCGLVKGLAKALWWQGGVDVEAIPPVCPGLTGMSGRSPFCHAALLHQLWCFTHLTDWSGKAHSKHSGIHAHWTPPAPDPSRISPGRQVVSSQTHLRLKCLRNRISALHPWDGPHLMAPQPHPG